MIWFLLIFIVIDIAQTLYIRHLKKEIAFRDGESNTEEKATARPKKGKQSDKAHKGSVLDLTSGTLSPG